MPGHAHFEGTRVFLKPQSSGSRSGWRSGLYRGGQTFTGRQMIKLLDLLRLLHMILGAQPPVDHSKVVMKPDEG